MLKMLEIFKTDFLKTIDKRDFLINFTKNQNILNLYKLFNELTLTEIQSMTPIDIDSLSSTNEIEYVSIYEDIDKIYTLGLFILPKNSNLPIHDHSDMLVFSKVIKGRLEITSFQEESRTSNGEIIVSEVRRNELKEGDCCYLTPLLFNFHYIYAVDNVLFLDLILPGYNEDDGRDCNYYKYVRDERTNKDKLLKLI